MWLEIVGSQDEHRHKRSNLSNQSPPSISGLTLTEPHSCIRVRFTRVGPVSLAHAMHEVGYGELCVLTKGSDRVTKTQLGLGRLSSPIPLCHPSDSTLTASSDPRRGYSHDSTFSSQCGNPDLNLCLVERCASGDRE